MWIFKLDGRGAARVVALLLILVVFIALIPALLLWSLLLKIDFVEKLLDKLQKLITAIFRSPEHNDVHDVP